MNDVLPTILAWLAAALAAAAYWDGRRRWRRPTRKPTPAKTSGPQAAVIEIVEKGRTTDDTPGGSLIVPNDVRINGQSLLIPKDAPVTIHEIDADDSTVVNVTLTLFARRVVIAAEGDL